jgi:hypothetical protein
VQCTRNQLQEFEDEDLLDKMSILLTPTGYSDGSLNTVIPPYQETLKFSGFSSFSVGSSWEVENDVATTDGSSFSNLSSLNTVSVGKKYRAVFTTTGGSVRFYFGGSGDTPYTVAAGTHTLIGVAESNKVTFRNLSTAASVSNFTLTEIQEADFDFSRGSSATRVNEQGLVEDVQILSGELVQNGNFEEIGSELVTNGNFDTDSDWNLGSGEWTISNGFAVADNANNNLHTSSAVASATGLQYKVTFRLQDVTQGYVRVGLSGLNATQFNSDGTYTLYIESDGNRYLYFRPFGFTGKLTNVSVKEVGQNWSLNDGAFFTANGVNLKHTPSAGILQNTGYTPLTVGNQYKLTYEITEKNAGGVKLNSAVDTTMDSSVGTHIKYFEADGTLITFSRTNASNNDVTIDNISVIEITDDTDLPRIDFTDGTGSLLLEPQSTNLVTYSEDFSQWILGSGTSIESGYTAPDGTNSAYKVSGGGGALTLASISNQTQTRTIWAKTVSGTGQAHLCSYFGNTNNLFTITEEWQRFEVNGTTVGSGSTSFYAVDFRGSTTLSEIILWGAQLEDLSYATSYIPTSGSTVTRSADVANNSGNADLFNDSEGVLYAEIAALADDQTYREIAISDGTSNNRIEIRYTNTSNTLQSVIRSGGTVVMLESTSSYNITNFNKIAVSYKANEFKMYVNSTEVAVDTSGNAPTGLKELAFDDGNGANDFYGDVKCVAVFKEALSNDLLERLTGEGYESFRLLAEANNYTII